MRTIHRVEVPAPLPSRKRVAAYARVSSGKDAMLHSLSAQVSYFSNLIQRRGDWEFAGVYADEALSGTKAQRPEFQRLMADCRTGMIDTVLTKSISRFARNTLTTLEAVRELKSLGVEVWFERENISSLSGDGELMLTVLSSFAQEESRSVSENCGWRLKKRMEKGEPVGFFGMYGYDYKDGNIVIHEEQAAVVRNIFDWYIGGMGMTVIARRLNEQGIPTYCGGKWTPSRVGYLLENEKLSGNSLLQKFYTVDHISKIRKPNRGERTRYFAEGTHPAIISTEIFEEAGRIRQERAARFHVRSDSRKCYPFTGMIRCEHCGKKYRRKKAVAGFVWQCSTYLQEGKDVCPAKQIPEGTLTAIAAEVLGLPEFDSEVFQNNITEIRVPGNNRLTFIFQRGRIVHREWQDRSRRESWTEEKKQAAREHALRGRRGGACE